MKRSGKTTPAATIPIETEVDYREGAANLRARVKALGQQFRPKPPLRVSEWAEQFRHVESNAAMPGRWNNAIAPFQVEPMDSIGDRNVREITLLWAAQSGKSSGVLGNGIGFFIHYRPAAMIYMAPNKDDVEDFAKEKLEPIIAETPVLAALVGARRGSERSSTIRHKQYPGGFWLGVGSNSPRGLRGRSAPIIIEDECDAYQPTDEGDPSELLWRRARSFPNKKRIRATTPTIKGKSRGEEAYLRSDRRRWFVPCPHCGTLDYFRWANFVIGRDENGEKIAAGSHMRCESCQGEVHDRHKRAMNAAGRWVAERPFRGHAGFHLPAMALPWVTFADLAENFLNAEAQGDLQTWVNTDLAETWDAGGESIDKDSLKARLEDYPAQVPAGVLMVTAGVDTQDDRLEISRWGYGLSGESWLIDHRILYGNPAELYEARVDKRLDEWLLAPMVRTDGVKLGLAAVCVDAQGHFYEEVLAFAKKRERRLRVPVAAIRGGSEWNSPLWPLRSAKSSKKHALRGNVYTLGVASGKRSFFQRLARIKPDGADGAAGFVHLPRSWSIDGEEFKLDDEFVSQLASERERSKRLRGSMSRWFEELHPRHEALDCRIYADAALAWRSPNWRELAKNRAAQAARATTPAVAPEKQKTEKPEPPPEPPKPKTPGPPIRRPRPGQRPRRGGFVTNWRG